MPSHSVIAARRLGRLRWVLPCLLLLLLGLRPVPVGAQVLPPQGQLTDLAGTLEREGTYVASRARPQVPFQAEERLQQLITDAEFLNVTLRFAVLDQAPRGYADLNEFTVALANAIRLRNGVLVVATPQQVTAVSDQVPREEAAALVTSAQNVLERDGLPAGVESAAAGFVARAAQTVVPEARPTAGPVTTTTGAAERGANGPPFWLFLPGLALLGAGVGLYGWTTRRRWHELLGALEGAEVTASDLATTGRAAPATMENAQRRLEIGQRALATLRAIPWWQTWLWPWLPPPQLALAERAFSESLRLLGDPTAAAVVAPPSTPDAARAPGAFAPARLSSSPADTPAAGPSTPAAPPRVHDADGTASSPAADAAPGAPATSAPDLRAPSSPLAPVPPTDTPPGTGLVTPSPAVGASSPAPPPTAQPSGGRWWQRRQPATAAEPAASLDPEHILKGLAPQDPLGCFFCGRPLGPRDVEIATVPLAGLPVRPLVCPRHGAALAAGDRPDVRARLVAGHEVAWFQDPQFHPAWDYNPTDSGPTVAWDALPPPDALLEPAPTVIVHADDPRWPERSENA